MKTNSVYDILLIYFDQRQQQTLDTHSIKELLASLGKSPEEIDEILLEFDDEWDLEFLHRSEVKKAKLNSVVGSFLAITAGTVSILSALNILTLFEVPVVFYGFIGTGIILFALGRNKLKTSKIREDRLRLKYQNR